jgi:hypothetical protein
MLKDRLEKALGARVMSLASMPVGFGLQGLKVDLADGRRLAVKLREGSAHADLSLEAYMLGELARHSDLPVPAVHLSEPDLLAMDFIETDGGGITARVERHAAELNRSMSSIGKMSEHPSPPYNLPDIGEAPRLQGLTQRLRRLPLRSLWRLRWDLVGRLLGMGV